MAEPIKSQNYIREVLAGQTAAQWAASGQDVYLQAFETVRESDTGKEKTGPGLFSELPYDNPQGQTWQNTSGTPTSTDLIGYTAVTAAVTATAEWTCDDVGTEDATIIVGEKLYTVVASGATGDQIDAGANATEYADNIATKVTADTADTLCTAENVGAVITFTANTTGAAGNDIPLSTTDENITADVFVDGADAVYTPKATSAFALAGGNGDVSGPSSSTDNAIARFDSTTGKVIQNSTVTLSDAGVFVGGKTSLNAALGTDDTYEGTQIAGLVNLGGVTQWEAVTLNSSSQWVLADANGAGLFPARGVAVATALTTVAVTVLVNGVVRNDAWNWTPGGAIYLSATPGALTQTAPSTTGDNVQQVGYALTADIAFFDFNSTFVEVP